MAHSNAKGKRAAVSLPLDHAPPDTVDVRKWLHERCVNIEQALLCAVPEEVWTCCVPVMLAQPPQPEYPTASNDRNAQPALSAKPRPLLPEHACAGGPTALPALLLTTCTCYSLTSAYAGRGSPRAVPQPGGAVQPDTDV